MDPNIPSDPYCRKCLDKAKGELLRKLLELDKMANYVKIHQTELLDTLDDSMKELISKHNIDPMLTLILSTMYLTGPIVHAVKTD